MPCEQFGEFQIEPDVVFIKMADRSGWIVIYLEYLIIFQPACKVKNGLMNNNLFELPGNQIRIRYDFLFSFIDIG